MVAYLFTYKFLPRPDLTEALILDDILPALGFALYRVVVPVLVTILVAGRTGAAFAAQLGTMQVNEEIDALKTMGISPMEFLVLPRMLALILMMPLLTIYADIVGILGGAVVGVGMLDLGATQYFHQTQEALAIKDFAVGLIKSKGVRSVAQKMRQLTLNTRLVFDYLKMSRNTASASAG